VQAGILHTAKKTSVEFIVIVMICFSLFTMNYFIKPAYVGDSHCWCVTTCNSLSKWSKDWSGASVSYHTHTEIFFQLDFFLQWSPSGPSLFPACPLFGY
jgi:hypothetical protein